MCALVLLRTLEVNFVGVDTAVFGATCSLLIGCLIALLAMLVPWIDSAAAHTTRRVYEFGTSLARPCLASRRGEVELQHGAQAQRC